MPSISSCGMRVRGIWCTVSGHGVLWALAVCSLGVYRIVIIVQKSNGFRFILSVKQNIVKAQVAMQNANMIV